jgi:hypothetical protein
MLSTLIPEQLKELHSQLGLHAQLGWRSTRSAEQAEQLSADRRFIEDQLSKWERLRTLAEAGQIAEGETRLFRPPIRGRTGD